MCGIAGVLRPRGTREGESAEDVVERMTRALSHRGPDGRGVSSCAAAGREGPCDVAFGHTRLAIIDLTERAAQPMANEDRSVWLTFNGEIYNHQDLRAELTASGVRFRSESDTEVILRGYERWGAAVVDRIDGMFAWAVWDARASRLVLARDRLGIKPLYVHDGSEVLFASEVRALLASRRISPRLDKIAIDQYLAYQTVPSPRTLIEGIRMVGAGTVEVFQPSGQGTTRRYWNLLDSAAPAGGPSRPITAGQVRDGVQAELLAATRRHLVSDVPVGIFLSGGIDSSALVALVRATGARPSTFTVAFPNHGVDEAPFARAVARAFDTDHHEIHLTEADMLARVQAAVVRADHPTGDGVNTALVSEAVRGAGITVALSGLGGDEFFGGYPSFRRFEALGPLARAWRYSPRALRRAMSSAVQAISPESPARAKTAALLESDGSVTEAVPIMRQLFAADQRGALLAPDVRAAARGVADPYVERLTRAFDTPTEVALMARLSYAEASTYMQDVLLRDTDQMSMRHALEVRVPLLDHHLVEHVMGLPDALKQPGDKPKRLLCDSLGVALPAESIGRPKQGFVLPFDHWMRTVLEPFCAHHLGSEGLAGRDGFDRAGVTGVWRSFQLRDGRTNWSRPWALVALNAWIESVGASL